jgi:hypothetical protein
MEKPKWEFHYIVLLLWALVAILLAYMDSINLGFLAALMAGIHCYFGGKSVQRPDYDLNIMNNDYVRLDLKEDYPSFPDEIRINGKPFYKVSESGPHAIMCSKKGIEDECQEEE